MSEHAAAVEAAPLAALSDDELLARQSDLVARRRAIDLELAGLAAEIARRSARDAGFGGLAQRLGDRTPERLIQRTTGVTAREAGALVRVGELLASGGSAPLADALGSGLLSVPAADAIATGLGTIAPGVSAEAIEVATTALLERAGELTVEQLGTAARDARAELDVDAVLAGERRLREQRGLRLSRMPDGMTRLTALLDPESAAIVVSIFDGVTSPRRGGPRFGQPSEVERAERLARDPRTTEQLALDAFVDLLRLGAEVEPGRIVGARRPAVRVLVTDADLARRAGAARLEGQSAPVSIATAERHTCDAGTVPIHFDGDGQVVNVGREHRLFTARQRVGLAARDGGCLWPSCDRPPSWCEAHHIDEWDRHGGRTDIADGVLLCRFHHLLVHDRGWRITRTGAAYSAVPPPRRDPRAAPIPLPSKSAILNRLRT